MLDIRLSIFVTCSFYICVVFFSDLMYMATRRGQIVLIYQDNIFHVNRRYEDKTFWKCMEYKKQKCKCRCTTVKGKIKRSKIDHNHPPNTIKIRNKSMNMRYIINCEDPFETVT